ncbi:MAG: hypothetical protein ACYC3L_15625 [Gemmatimonadaceae bacterium]
MPYELVITAPSLERAQYVLDVVLACEALANNAASFYGEQLDLVPEEAPANSAEAERHKQFLDRSQGVGGSLHFASVLAARLSQRRTLQYALFKLRLSYHLCSVHIMDLDPSHWRAGTGVSSSPPDHVALATALQLAYSAIEELGLEVRASKEKPSMVNGEWNQPVLKELQARLIKARINLEDTEIWYRRSTPTLVERRYPVARSRKTKWTHGSIRDVEVNIEEALQLASRLRSRIAAHRLPTIASSLTYYDVANVQLLARRLLIETAGCWRAFGTSDA